MASNFRGKLFLGGGGNEVDSLIFDRFFYRSLKGGKVIYIPLAWARDAAGYDESYKWFTKMLAQHGLLPEVEMWLDLSGKTEKSLQGVDAIYIGGGNTFNLLHILTKQGVDQLILNFLVEGGVVYGGSAGAIIMGDSIDTVQEENEIGPRARSKGFHLLHDLSVRCHYTKDDASIIDSCYAGGFKGPILCLPERSGVIMENGFMTVEGSDPVCLYYSKGESDSIKVGENIMNWLTTSRSAVN